MSACSTGAKVSESAGVQVPEMPHKRGSHMSATLGDSLYVMGGWDSENYLDSLEVFDTRADRWRCAPSMAKARAYGSSAVLDDQIYVIGGLDGSVGLRATYAVSLCRGICSLQVHSASLSHQPVSDPLLALSVLSITAPHAGCTILWAVSTSS